MKGENGKYMRDEYGKLIPVDFEMKVSTENERINAINKLCQMRGWDAPIKTENTGFIKIGYGEWNII
jgi:hypothetical protein